VVSAGCGRPRLSSAAAAAIGITTLPFDVCSAVVSILFSVGLIATHLPDVGKMVLWSITYRNGGKSVGASGGFGKQDGDTK